MRKKLFLVTLLALFTSTVACGKKARPIPRDRVLEKAAEKQPAQSKEEPVDLNPTSENKDTN